MAGSNPKPPDGLSPEALAEWGRVCKELRKSGHLTKEARAVLTIYVRTWALNDDAAKQVAAHGGVIKYPNGVPGPSPFYKQFMDTGKALRGLLSDLGLTPASRSKLPPPPGKEPELEI